MKIFDTVAAMAADRPRAGNNIKTRGEAVLLDGGNAEYYIQTLADYGGTPPLPADVDIVCANGNIAVKMAVDVTPFGGIIAYYGDLGNIPTGWSLCDGTNGTPDMRAAFPVGVGGAYTLGGTGGTSNITYPAATNGHALTIAEMPAHSHTVALDSKVANGTADGAPAPVNAVGADSNASSIAYQLSNTKGGDQPHVHSIDNTIGIGANVPPYIGVHWIMRTGIIGQVIAPLRPEGLASYINVSGSVQLDAQGGNITVFEVSPNGNITDMAVINLPAASDIAYGCAIKIISDGSSTVVFDPQFNWEDNTVPTLTTDVGKWDWIVGFSVDQGVTLDAKTSIQGLD